LAWSLAGENGIGIVGVAGGLQFNCLNQITFELTVGIYFFSATAWATNTFRSGICWKLLKLDNSSFDGVSGDAKQLGNLNRTAVAKSLSPN
jgi:hypothetical protein